MNDFIVSMMLFGSAFGGSQMPFWVTAGQFGIMPESSGALALVQASTQFDESRAFQYRWGTSIGARSDASSTFQLIPDELYVSGRWKVFNLDLGIKHRERDFLAPDTVLGSLSTTSGHLIWSSNARSLPGYTATLLPVNIPFTKGHLQIYGVLGDYRTTDTRYVADSYLHTTQAYARFNSERFTFVVGLDHYALWGGTSPDFGVLPFSVHDYFLMITGSHGGSNAAETDQINILGDQRGAELFRADYKGNGWKLTLQHERPYDDTGGMKFRNFPDAVNTVSFSFEDKDRWISDIVYEYHYTMWQSGTWHEKDGAILGGCDDYFNNRFEYKSGWTCYGRTIGDPLLLPVGTRDGSWSRSGITLGVESNRLKAHHLGLGGRICRKWPYRFMATYTQNYGCYQQQYTGENQAHHEWGTVKETPLRELYLGLSSIIPSEKLHVSFIPGIWADFGELQGNDFAVTLGIRYNL